MKQFNVELWLADNPECYRTTVWAACWFHAQQIVIGLHAPVFLRRF